jgi:phage baseplate assembly protein W
MVDQNFFWSDIDENYNRQSDGDIQKDVDVQAILNSLRNIILTIQGQRRMLPTFATNIWGLLFEPIDEITARLIAEGLLESIRIWETRIEVTGFDIEPVPDQNFYRCRLKFTIVGRDQTESVDFILTR